MSEGLAEDAVADGIVMTDEERAILEDEGRFRDQVKALEEAEAADPKHEPIIIGSVGGTRKFILNQPPKVDGRLLREISIRPLLQGDVDDWTSGEIGNSREMLLRLTDLPPAVMKALHWTDAEILHGMFWDSVPEWLRKAVPDADAA